MGIYSYFWKSGQGFLVILVFFALSFWDATQIQGKAILPTFAVVVGIADYAEIGDKNGDLRYAEKDAKAFVQFLKSSAGGSVPAQNIILLLNRQATRTNILKALKLFAKAPENARIIYFFSGHGETGSFIPADYAITKKGLSHESIKAAFRQSKARMKWCLADACLSGSIQQESLVVNKPKVGNTLQVTPTNVLVFMSSRKGQLSQESGFLQQGMFTYFLLDGLKGAADADSNRLITVRELYRYVKTKVTAFSRHRQSPLLYGKFDKEMIMSRI